MTTFYNSRFHAQIFDESRKPAEASTLEECKGAWLKALGCKSENGLQRRLAWDGLQLSDVWHRIGTASGEPEYNVIQPGLLHAWILANTSVVDQLLDEGNEKLPFGEIWEVLVQSALDFFVTHSSIPGHPLIHRKAIRDTAYALKEQLAELASSTLYHEFNQTRDLGGTLLFHTGHDSAQQVADRSQYRVFVRRICEDGLQSILNAYPVLAFYLCTTIDSWLITTQELFQRIIDNEARIKSSFGLAEDSQLAGVHMNLSDHHHGGRSVAILLFRSSAQPEVITKVVYKPRGMNLEATYQQTVRRIPPPPGDAGLRSLRVISIDDYGFIEFVERVPCTGPEQLKKFYRNAGRLTAFLHLLGCTDCHFENLIAAQDQLILIDTETLLEGKIPINQLDQTDTITATKQISEKLASSAVRTGLLPYWSFWGNERIATDVSALGIEPNTASKSTLPGWLHVNTDHMYLGVVEAEPQVLNPSPVPHGIPNQLSAHVHEFTSGFEDQLVAFLSVKNEWCTDNGILDQFKGIQRRIVLRATRVYHSLKMQQFQPDHLRSHIHQGLVLEQLGRAFLSFKDKPKYWSVFRDEIEAMSRLDVPFFTILCDDCDLILHDTVVPGYLQKSGLELAKQKIAELDADEIAFQVKMARELIQARKMRVSLVTDSITKESQSNHTLSAADKLEEGIRLADLLLKEASFQDEIPFWLAVDVGLDADKLCYGVLGPGLYGGHMGIALFLNSIGMRLQEKGKLYRDVSQRIVREYIHNLQTSEKQHSWSNWWRDSNLGLTGAGGLILAFHLLKEQDTTLSATIGDVIEKFLDSIDLEKLAEDNLLDIMSGTSGLIGPLLLLKTTRALAIAKQCGDRLLELQLPDGGWRVGNGKALTGFSHGASGILLALAKLYDATKNGQYAAAIQNGLAFERSLYSEGQGNWLDLRVKSSPPKFAVSWCHGAPGIALSRLGLVHSMFWNKEMEKETLAALHTTSTMSNHNDCLCCGSVGRASILRYAATVLQDDRWRAEADRIEASVFYTAKQNGYVYRCFETKEANVIKPGLFTGTSGIGLNYLESAFGDHLLTRILTAGLL